MERKKYSRVVEGWKGKWWDSPKHTPAALAKVQKWLNFVHEDTELTTRFKYAQEFILKPDSPSSEERQQVIEGQGGWDALEKRIKESNAFRKLRLKYAQERLDLVAGFGAVYSSLNSSEPEIVETAENLDPAEIDRIGHERIKMMNPLDKRIFQLDLSMGGKREYRHFAVGKYLGKSPRLIRQHLDRVRKLRDTPIY